MSRKKVVRRAVMAMLTGTMGMGSIAGVATTAMAETVPSDLNTSTDAQDTSSIRLLKDYVTGSETQRDTSSPVETFSFTVERYGLWNVGEDGNGVAAYSSANMPTFTTDDGSSIFTITSEKGDAENAESDLGVIADVPTYNAVGDYWYKVTETDNNVAGVIYGTNDSKTEDLTADNGAHDGVYYIHVQVTNAETKGEYIRTVTLHKTAPDASITNTAYETWYADNHDNTDSIKKVDNIQNEYYAGSLSITKNVEGNAGDKNELFKVTVVFKNETGASMLSDITYKNFYSATGEQTTTATSIGWTDRLATVENDGESSILHTNETKTVEFYIKDGTTVTFDNIPYGVSYTVTETQPVDDKYTHEFTQENADAAGTFNGKAYAADAVTAENADASGADKWNAATATGSISDDSDSITLTNTKESIIDIGVITENAPYIALILTAGAGAVVFAKRRRNKVEE